MIPPIYVTALYKDDKQHTNLRNMKTMMGKDNDIYEIYDILQNQRKVKHYDIEIQ